MPDLALVLAPENRGWILDRICSEIASQAPDRSAVHVWDGTIPRCDSVFFSHYSLFVRARDQGLLRGQRSLVFLTHPPDRLRARVRLAQSLNDADCVISMSSLQLRRLRRLGLRTAHHIAIPGADPDLFKGHRRLNGVVGFCSAYYERKEPSRILNIVRALPNERFVLVGRGWEDWNDWPSLSGLPNLEYVNARYEDYPAQYSRMDVFVSASSEEGGPIPLLEAMMSNVVPVATDTGFASDLIKTGENGLLVPIHASTRRFVRAIQHAREFDADIRSSVQDRTWRRFTDDVLAVALT